MRSRIFAKFTAVTLVITLAVAGCSRKSDADSLPAVSVTDGIAAPDTALGMGESASPEAISYGAAGGFTAEEKYTVTDSVEDASVPESMIGLYRTDGFSGSDPGGLFYKTMDEADADYGSDEAGFLTGEPDTREYVYPAAGLLTAGEWNDNRHFDFLKNLLNNGQRQDYSQYFKDWELTPFARLAIHVSSGEITVVSGSSIGADNVNNATVTVYSSSGNVLWKSKTDTKGMTYAFYRLTDTDAVPSRVTVISSDVSFEQEVIAQDLKDENTM